MGKGIIKSGGDDGFYEVELTFERESLDKIISSIDAHIESLTSVIDTIGEGTEKELLKLERNSYIKKKEYLQNNMPEDPTVSAWCADLTEDIAGDVGTIEVPGERGVVQIQPGYEDNSTYDSTRDGQLQPSIASTPAATFYNLAMLPGWQKWKPTYRYGVILNIDTDANTCDVKLDEVESSQQNLNINQELNLTGISVSYMSCDSIAFEDGDSVLVKFEGQTWDGAQVVGFKDNPKPCDFLFRITRDDGTVVDGAQYEWATIFYCRNATGQSSIPEDIIYDDDPESSTYQFWSFKIPEYMKSIDGYWVEFRWIEDSIQTIYPYKWIDSEKYQESDLIKQGKYEAVVPYWKTEFSNTGIAFVPPPDLPIDCWPDEGCSGGGYTNSLVVKTYTIHSSIPHTVTFFASNAPVGAYYGKYSAYSCRLQPCEDCQDAGYEHWFCQEISDSVTAISSNGDSSNNIETDPISSDKVVTPPEHTVQTDSHSMTFTHDGADCEWIKPCGGLESEETVTIVIPFKYFNFTGNVYALPNT